MFHFYTLVFGSSFFSACRGYIKLASTKSLSLYKSGRIKNNLSLLTIIITQLIKFYIFVTLLIIAGYSFIAELSLHADVPPEMTNKKTAYIMKYWLHMIILTVLVFWGPNTVLILYLSTKSLGFKRRSSLGFS